MPNPENIAGQGFHTNPERINKKGNPGSKWLSTLLREKLEQDDNAGKLLRKLIELAIEKGDLNAIKEVIDRVDGKANQEIKVDGVQSAPPIQIFNNAPPMAGSEDKIDV